MTIDIIAVCKDSCVVYACGFDRNGKWEWFCESKLRCKNDAAKMTSERALATLLADGITSMNNLLISFMMSIFVQNWNYYSFTFQIIFLGYSHAIVLKYFFWFGRNLTTESHMIEVNVSITIQYWINGNKLADLGGVPGAAPPQGSRFFHF